MKSTSGGRESWNRRIAGLTALLGVVSGLALLYGSPARALTPPIDKAEVVFESGGRIVVAKADGSDRRVLTSPGPRAPFMDDDKVVANDSIPSISPDGRRLVFLRTGYARKSDGFYFKVMVAHRDGSRARAIWHVAGNRSIADLAWSGNDAVLFSESRQIRPLGYREETVFSFKRLAVGAKRPTTLFRRSFGPKTTNMLGYQTRSLEAFRIDPAGRRIVYESHDPEGTSLVVRDLKSGKARTIAKGGGDPAFSPNGKSIVFAGLSDDPMVCRGVKCLPSGLYLIRANGSRERQILRTPGQSRAPVFSPDGTRIAFHSNRNFPVAKQDANEIYTVRSDGSCLTWLTNGSPESQTPSWELARGVSFSPGVCGMHDRAPLVEFHDIDPPVWGPYANFWAGRRIEGRLLSSPAPAFSGTVDYGDCAYFDRTDCQDQISIGFQSQCSSFASWVEYGDAIRRITTRRGAIVVKTTAKGRLSSTEVSTGRKDILIGRLDQQERVSWTRPTDFADHLAIVDALRPLKSMGDASDLPNPQLSKRAFKWLRRTERIYRDTGSYSETAKRVDSEARWVKRDLVWFRQLKSMGPIATFTCSRNRD